jgi:hypothetical protein
MAGLSGFRTARGQVNQALTKDHSHRKIDNRAEDADFEGLYEAREAFVHKFEPEKESQAEASTAQPERHVALGSLHVDNQDDIKEDRYVTLEPILQPDVDHKKGESYDQCSGYCVRVSGEIHSLERPQDTGIASVRPIAFSI